MLRSRYEPIEARPDIAERAGEMQRVCRAHSCALAAAALQFPVAHPCVACVIPGARSVSKTAAPLSDTSASPN